MLNQISGWLMIVSAGVWTGVIVTFEVERTNLWGRMPIEQYAVDFRRSLLRVDPMQPLLGAIAAVSAAVFGWYGIGSAAIFAWTGFGLIVLVIFSSIVIAEPINSQFRRLAEGQVPDRADHHRRVWCRFHSIRNVAALASFAILAAAVMF